jgi:3-oxoacyl-[acyl-carrier-protein] synthase-3
MKSFANELPACMYAGAVRSPDGSLTGWAEYPSEEWGKQSIFSFKQDTRLLGVKVVPIGSQYWKELVEKHNIDLNKLTWFLPHISSEFFREKIANEITRLGVPIAPEKWFTNLSSVGNIGSAAPYVMLEELFNNNKLKKGDTIVIMVPESARFTYIYAHLTVV